MNDYEELKVSLTTSKFSPYSIDVDQTQQEHQSFVDLNIPVCVSEYYLEIYSSSRKELIEHIASIAAKEVMKEVFIDVLKKSIFVGVDHNNENTGVIIYNVLNQNKYEAEFFKRWQETKHLMVEHQVLDLSKRSLFAIKGLWIKDHWDRLEIFPSSRITIA